MRGKLTQVAPTRKRARAGGRRRDWHENCQKGSNGALLNNHANVLLALRSDDEWGGVFAFDEMRGKVMRLAAGPAEPRCTKLPRPTQWTDADDAIAQEWFQLNGLVNVSRDVVAAAIDQRSRELAYHPLRDYLTRLNWDGIPRVEGGTTAAGEVLAPWLHTYMGAENTAYTKEVGTLWLKAAAARLLRPGCKVDTMLILEGAQGTGKSSACRILAGDEFFSDNLPDVRTKDAAAHVIDKWIIEISELDSLSKADDLSLKAFLSRQVDRFRPAYHRHEIERPRQCVFIGTTNKPNYLTDETGGRRFWPVATTSIDLWALERDRDQIWAEAVAILQRDQQWFLLNAAVIDVVKKEQEDRFDADVWTDAIATYIAGVEAEAKAERKAPQVTPGEIMRRLGIDTPKMDRAAQLRVVKILTSLGWKRGPRNGSRGQLWIPGVRE